MGGEGISCLALLGMKQDLTIFCHFNTCFPLEACGTQELALQSALIFGLQRQAQMKVCLDLTWLGPWAKDIGLPVTLPVDVTQTGLSGKSPRQEEVALPVSNTGFVLCPRRAWITLLHQFSGLL